MARYRDVLSSFMAGEVSPRLHGKTDISQFKQACEEITNMVVHFQGGASRRPGSQYKADLTVDEEDLEIADQVIKAVPFVRSKTESYIILFGVEYDDDDGVYNIRVWDVANGVFRSVVEKYSNGLLGGYTTLKAFDGYTEPEEMPEIQYKQFGNAIFFSQKDKPPFALDFATTSSDSSVYLIPFWAYAKIGQRAGGALVAISDTNIIDAHPYDDRNTTATTIAASATTGAAITLTASAALFDVDHVGTLVRVTGDSALTAGVALITAWTDPTHVTARVLRDFEDTNASSNWAFSSWNDDNGWPKAIEFFENRIAYGYIDAAPNKVWMSKIGQLNFMRQEQFIDETPLAVTNNDAWSFSIPGGEFNIIQWLAAKKNFFIGTVGAEIRGEGPDNTLAMGPLNFNFVTETAHGSELVQPIRRDNILIFIERSGRMIRELSFNFDEDTYNATKIMTLAEHMPRKTQNLVPDTAVSNGTIAEIVHQGADAQITWFRDSNGGIFAMTRDRDVEGAPTAFHYHQIAGVTTDTPGAKVLSICSCPSPNGSHDDIYLVVRRSWDVGSDKIYLEKIGREYEHDNIYASQFEDIDDKPIYLDSAMMVIADPAPATAFEGFDHLVDCGQVLHAIADGHYIGEVEVTSEGIINLETAATELIVGMYYRSQLVPVQMNAGSVLGSSQGADKTSDQVFVHFVRSIGGKLGFMFDGEIDEDQMNDIDFRDPEANQNDPIEIFTGVKEVTPPLGWATKMNLVIRQDLPFPQHVAAITFRGVVND